MSRRVKPIVMPATTPLLIISGSMGAGKTNVLSEASDLLSLAGIAHAAIDLDCWQPGLKGLTRGPPVVGDAQCEPVRVLAGTVPGLNGSQLEEVKRLISANTRLQTLLNWDSIRGEVFKVVDWHHQVKSSASSNGRHRQRDIQVLHPRVSCLRICCVPL